MAPTEYSPIFVAVAGIAVFVVALSKAGFGGIVTSLAVPLVATVSDTMAAVAVLFPVYLLIDAAVVWGYRRSIPWRLLVPMLLAGSVGTVVAVILFGMVDTGALSLVLGVIAVASALRFAAQARGLMAEGVRRDPRRLHPLPLLGWVAPAGFFSFFLMGAVPAQLYLLPFRLDPRVHVSATVAFFTTMNWSRVPIVLELGIVTPATLWLSALLLPIIPAGIVAGRWITARVERGLFFAVAHALLFVLGLYMVADGIDHLVTGGTT